MANGFNPALYLYLQSAVGTSDAAGYTRLLGKTANLQHYLEFSNSAIEAGFAVPAANTTANLPVLANIRLYFSDPAYGPPPPPPSLPVEPIHGPVRERIEPIVPPVLPPTLLPGVYEASDGTVLTVEKNAGGQITGFSGTGKDGNNYALTTAIVTEKAPGRQSAVDVLWLKASLSITVGAAAPPLVFAFRFAPTANLFQVLVEQNNVSTGINVDYAGATAANGSAQLTRTLLYYEDSFMSEGLQVSASQQDPGMYLAAACSFWPMIDWVDFFSPALQKVAGAPPAAATAPLAAIGSVNFLNNGVPAQYPLATYLSQAEEIVGPALGPLAASFVDSTLPFASLAQAAMWLGSLANAGTGQQALITELTTAYQDWVAFIAAQSAPDPKKLPINPFEPEEGDD
jgi:hypothetical protein